MRPSIAPMSVSRALAWGMGIALPLGETVRRWGVWGYPPSWLDDYLIGLFLLVAAWRGGRHRPCARAWLAGAWGFAAGVLYCSFFGHLREIDQPVDSKFFTHVPLAILIGAAFGVTLVALVITLLSDPAQRHPRG